ncbi:hypothetical protein GFS60_01282 [Rhodococcus sp. WAY2]|nr:hypothetical protein GFS60_01282 [Rhodococcus sp. WAY2]
MAAFKLLFDWAVVTGSVQRCPVATHTVRRRDGAGTSRPTVQSWRWRW